jgi:hypothetical protein
MSRKVQMFSLAVVSAMMLAVPAVASAINALHLEDAPAIAPIDSNGTASLSTTGGTTVTCGGVSGSAPLNFGTTGSMQLLFEFCTTNLGGTCTSEGQLNSIRTTVLPFHSATVAHRTSGAVGPGILVTPGANEHFATFTCHNVAGFLTVESVIKGNGVIGTITAPSCGATASQATVVFQAASNGVQTHNKLANTATEYTLKKGGENTALGAHVTLTLQPLGTQLVCT